MPGLNQPLWLQNSSYPASLDRQAIAAASAPGVLGLADLAVTQRAAGANFSVDVAAGRVVIPMTDAPNQGSALCTSTAVNNLVVTGAPGAGLSRIDLVIARVYDASLIGGSINGWQLEVVTGTPAASPAIPATPASSIVLARVTVAAGTASITTALITDARTPAYPAPAHWRPYTPAFYGDNSPSILGNGTLNGRYCLHAAKLVSVRLRLIVGSSTVLNTGTVRIALPSGLPGDSTFFFSAFGAALVMSKAVTYTAVVNIATTDPSNVLFIGPKSPTSCAASQYGSTDFQTGDLINTTFTYEAA